LINRYADDFRKVSILRVLDNNRLTESWKNIICFDNYINI
jgi:hypothetical protein